MSLSADLSGQVALVSGASSGLGAHFAQVLARNGAKVALGARRTDRLAGLAEEIQKAGGRALPIELDVREPESVERAVEHCETELGALTILVNNAGIAGGGPALETSPADWDAVVDTNLRGAWLLAQAAAKAMVDHGEGGTIVNTASVLGLAGSGQVAAYCASKAGLVNLTRALGGEWASYGIRVNAIAPGYFVTDLNRDFLESEAGAKLKKKIPLARFGAYEDLDGPLLLLVSQAGAYMTGSVVVVDGGQSAVL